MGDFRWVCGALLKAAARNYLVGGDEPALDGGTLQDEIKELGLDATGMEITVEGDTVKVSGEAVSQEMKEKVILAVGNVSGVASVEDSVPSAGEPVFHTVEKGRYFVGDLFQDFGQRRALRRNL